MLNPSHLYISGEKNPDCLPWISQKTKITKLTEETIFLERFWDKEGNKIKFEGIYEVSGSVVNGSLIPIKYKQFWVTKKKKREVEIIFHDGSITELEILPAEKERARINYIGINNYLDPLSSFLNILIGRENSKTIDGRRIYSLVVEKQDGYERGEAKKILIEDYVNIWADHKRNDLEYIEIKQEYSEGTFSMPEVMKIKFKGLLYKLRKI